MPARKTRLWGTLAAVSLIAVMSGAATREAKAADPGLTDDEIVIGMFAPLSGPLANFGYDALYAAKAWYDDVNKAGGIHGRKIRVIIEDDKCSAQDVVAVAKKYITVDKVFLLHGGSCTGATVAAQEIVAREKVPFIMLNASGDDAIFPPTRYTFGGFSGTQKSVGATLVQFAATHLKGRRIGYIGHDDAYGKSNFESAKAVADQLGAEIVAVERVSPKITDMTAPVLNLRAAQPDVIVASTYPGPSEILAQKAHEFGVTTPIVLGPQGIPAPEVFAKNVGNPEALKNFYYGQPLNDLLEGPKQQRWVDFYKAHYPDRTNPSGFMAYALPSAMAITRALEQVGRDLDREKFVDAMESLDFDSEVTAGRTTFSKDRRDGSRGYVYVKFDGKNHVLQPGSYEWKPVPAK